ncbi:MAG: hypothetical protein PUB22_07280 [Clostridiales bacterium]|nr:hypothetical protein [Clostridiales bacterium]
MDKRKKLGVVLIIIIVLIIALNKQVTLFPDETRIEITSLSGYEIDDENQFASLISQLKVKRSIMKTGRWSDNDIEFVLKYLNPSDNSADIYHLHFCCDGTAWIYKSSLDFIMYRVENPEIITAIMVL